jgi:hypothetical protein
MKKSILYIFLLFLLVGCSPDFSINNIIIKKILVGKRVKYVITNGTFGDSHFYATNDFANIGDIVASVDGVIKVVPPEKIQTED